MPSIQIVEDEVIVAKDIQLTLEQMGYTVTGIAAGTDQALRLFRESAPDLVLMDIMLQNNNDGIETARMIREIAPVPVIYLTAYADQATLDRAKQTSPYGYLLKPFQEQELRTAIEMAVYKFSMERQLQLKEQWLRATLQNIGDAVLTLDENGQISFINETAAALLNGTPEQFMQTAIGALPGDFPQELNRLRQIQGSRRTTAIVETKRPDGSPLFIDYTATPIVSNSVSEGMVVIFRDHTARITREISLRESEAQYRHLIELSPYGIAVHCRGEILFANQAAASLFGIADKSILQAGPDKPGYKIAGFFSAGTLMALENNFNTMTTENRPMPLVEGHIKRVDEQLITVEAAAIPIIFRQKECTHLMFHDITGRKILEDNLRQSQKMEAIGRLAGGVAHDFNNLLTAIMGYNDLAMLNAEPDSDLHGALSQIQNAADRAASLTSQLLAFSRRQVLQFKTLNLNTVISDMEKLLRRVIGEDVNLLFETETPVDPITADAGQLQQVVMNLAINARDAMPDGGNIVISTGNCHLDTPREVYRETIPPGDYVMLSVEDSGCGMDDYTQEHLFEPFFTTKSINRGTGLGLSSVYGIVHQSSGVIGLQTGPNGTVFEIYFPRSTEPASPEHGRTRNSSLPCGSERLLLCEDDSTVRTLTRTMLSGHGYHVEAFPNAMELIEHLKTRSGKYDLLLTDMIMPGISGLKLIEYIREQYPDIKIMLMSGYLDRYKSEQHSGKMPEHFLQKPFSLEQLLLKVRNALDDEKTG